MITVTPVPLSSPDKDKIKVWATNAASALVHNLVQHKIAALQAEASNAHIDLREHPNQDLNFKDNLEEIHLYQDFLKVLDRISQKQDTLMYYKLEINP